MSEETSPGYGNMADFVVPGGGPADADEHVRIEQTVVSVFKIVAKGGSGS